MEAFLETVGLVVLLGAALYAVVRLQRQPACQPGKGACGCNSCPLQSRCGLIRIEPARGGPEESEADDPSLPAHRHPDRVR
jgi:hypothetical protein